MLNAVTMDTNKVYYIKSLACTGALRRRIIDMGITPGAKIVKKRVAPFGDPIEFRVRDYALSMRKSEAELIKVEEK